MDLDSDTDHFESADEEFGSEHEEDKLRKQTQEIIIENKQEICILDNAENNTSLNVENNAITTNKSKQRVERKTRPHKTREPKTKLGTKIAKSEPPKPEVIDSWDDWEIDTNTKPESDLYSEKDKCKPDNNWESEESYMELPQVQENVANNETSGWGAWGNWGVSSLISSAQTITNSVSQGITTVLENGIGVPDPEELARQDTQQTENMSKETVENTGSGFGLGLDNFVYGVTHITKLVESTGTKVLTGGLDTLEVIGKKTMQVLQEGDPGLKKKRALFKPEKPVLSQILREAKEKAEENKQPQAKPHYETMFDDFTGLVHLEALEMLSKQCDIKLETLLESLSGSALNEMQETLAQIKELCELPDEEDDTPDLETVEEKLDCFVSEMNIQISCRNLLDSWRNIETWMEESTVGEEDIHQKAIESLAKLTAIAVEQFHKAGELLLVKERRSTVDEADSLVQFTITLTGIIGAVAAKFSEKLNGSDKENVNTLITNIFLEAANSSSYIQDAFNLMIPVLQVGAV